MPLNNVGTFNLTYKPNINLGISYNLYVVNISY